MHVNRLVEVVKYLYINEIAEFPVMFYDPVFVWLLIMDMPSLATSLDI